MTEDLDHDLTDEELFGEAPPGGRLVANYEDAAALARIDDADVIAAAGATVDTSPPIVLPSRNGERVLPNVRPMLMEHYRSHVLAGANINRLPPPRPLVDGWLDHDSLAVIYGRPGSAKSFVALDLACCIATGSWWHGRKTVRGKVLYVAAEGAYALGARVTSWLGSANLYDATLLEGLNWLPLAPNLYARDDAAALALLSYEVAPSLVIIDTLARCAGGADENSARDIGSIVANLDRIRDLTGAAVLVVHHTNAAGEKMRGNTALEGAVDTAIECRLEDKTVVLTSPKQKNREAPATKYLALTTIGDSCALTDRRRPTSTAEAVETLPASHRELLRFIAESDLGDGLSAAFVRDNGPATRSTTYRVLKNLADLGLLRRSEHGRTHRFSITDTGTTTLEEDTPE